MQILIGLGSNLGDRKQALRQGILKLRQFLRVEKVSRLYQSAAMMPDQAPADWNLEFLNCAVLAETALSPHELLQKTQAIEQACGRQQVPTSRHWAPRALDLDLLMGQEEGAAAAVVVATQGSRSSSLLPHPQEFPALELPHPGLHLRPFALLPAADLAPDWRLTVPGGKRGEEREVTLAELALPWRLLDVLPYDTQKATSGLGQWMGVLNVTPDSFSDGGLFLDPVLAVQQGQALQAQGAAIVDLGGQSTRPGAIRVDPSVEWQRLSVVLGPLVEALDIPISVDTFYPEVAQKALAAGARCVNDVSGLQHPAMAELLQAHGGGGGLLTVLTHSEHLAPECDPVAAVLQWAERCCSRWGALGLEESRLILDPGIGFGKTAQQSWWLLENAKRLSAFPVAWMVGHSRKSFLKTLMRADEEALAPAARDFETEQLSVHLLRSGISWLRVHDLSYAHRLERVWQAIS